MANRQWPSVDGLLAIADTAEELRKAIWLGWKTTAPDSPSKLPGFSEGIREIQQRLRMLDMLFHGRSVKAAKTFAKFETRREMFVSRCIELKIDVPDNGFDQWNAFADWEWAEAARPGDEEHIEFLDKPNLVKCFGTPTWCWSAGIVDRYDAIWKLFAELKLYFGFGAVVYSRNHWERPQENDTWLTGVPWVRSAQPGLSAPGQTDAPLDAIWLESLALQAAELRAAVLKEENERKSQPLLWPARPFKPSPIIVLRPGQPISSLPSAIPVATYEPTPHDGNLLRRQIPGIDPADPDWDHIKHYLVARNVNITEDTPIATVLAILGEWSEHPAQATPSLSDERRPSTGLLNDNRTRELLSLLWNAEDRSAGIPIFELPDDLCDEGLFTEWIATDLVEIVRRNHCYHGGGSNQKLVLERGHSVADFKKPGRKRVWELLDEAATEVVAPEIRHRVRLGKTGDIEACRLSRESASAELNSSKPQTSATGKVWFVELAREGISEGFRVIAHHLNQVLNQKAPSIQIDADEKRPGDSLLSAAEKVRRALPVLRTKRELPSRDSEFPIWTLGFVNWTNNLAHHITVDGVLSTGEYDLTVICNFLLEIHENWTANVWHECIKVPVENLYALRLAMLEAIEREENDRVSSPKGLEPSVGAVHSSDFHSVNWFGTKYCFTSTQAACVKVLWENWEQETPNVGEATILDRAGSSGSRLRDVFQKGKHPAWKRMIVSPKKGTYCLTPPSNS